MNILAIESSCDDTSVALVDITDNTIKILTEKTASQIDIHKKYGGVVPEIAGRKHAEKITPLVEEILKDFGKPDIIAVTSGPGLITGLIVGVETAKTLSYLWNIPLIGVNHIEGHIWSSMLQNTNNKEQTIFPHKNVNYPLVSLIVSGGHTELILSKKSGHYEKIGGTRDDAAGEAFDKIAKLIGLEYPGGPKISHHALSGNTTSIAFPRPMTDSDNFDMSFSGLKTSALYWLRDNAKKDNKTKTYQLKNKNLQDFCASYEQAIIDVLVKKSKKAIGQYKPKTFILGGGVSANKKLRESLQKMVIDMCCEFRMSNLKYSMDNATMIALASYDHAKKKEFISWKKLEANPNWKIYDHI